MKCILPYPEAKNIAMDLDLFDKVFPRMMLSTMNALSTARVERELLGSDRLRLKSGEMNRNAKEIFPAEVIDMFAINFNDEGRDQYDILWQDAYNEPIGRFFFAIRTFLAIVLSDFKKVETELWQAFAESLQDPLVAFIAMQRGENLHPDSRHNVTKGYFEAVTLCPLGLLQKSMRKSVEHVNHQHERVHVRDPKAKRIYPDLQRSFKYVTSCFINRVQSALATYGGRPMEALGASVESLYHGADVDLGMPIAPVHLQEFLDVHDGIIHVSHERIAQNDPPLSRMLKNVGHVEATNSLAAAAKRQQVPFKQLADKLRPETRERLSI